MGRPLADSPARTRLARPPLSGKRIVVLPDFYVDVVARLPAWDKALPAMRAIVERGGGNLPVGPIEFKVGGQAANVGVALARLGADVELVAETDALGRRMLEEVAVQVGLGLRHVRASATTSATLALETARANLMLSHAGPLRTFGPARLDAAAWRSIEGANAVVVTNWSQDAKGTDLLAAIARRLRSRDTFLYVDTGDLRHRPARDVRALLAARRIWDRVDAWGLNENEVRAAAGARGAVGRKAGGLDGEGPGAVVALAQGLAEHLGTRLDVHTRTWAASLPARGTTRRTARVPTPRGRALRLTGAGDTWNAGNLAGHLLGLGDEPRLRLAHAVATRYVLAPSGLAPSWRDVPARLWRMARGAGTAPPRAEG
jgi:sugar/nucleoside kinase (ribokinase family)